MLDHAAAATAVDAAAAVAEPSIFATFNFFTVPLLVVGLLLLRWVWLHASGRRTDVDVPANNYCILLIDSPSWRYSFESSGLANVWMLDDNAVSDLPRHDSYSESLTFASQWYVGHRKVGSARADKYTRALVVKSVRLGEIRVSVRGKVTESQYLRVTACPNQCCLRTRRSSSGLSPINAACRSDRNLPRQVLDEPFDPSNDPPDDPTGEQEDNDNNQEHHRFTGLDELEP